MHDRSPGDRTPNIVVIICDDLGYGDLSCQGGSTPTPNIDRLAGQGVRFTDFHSTGAVCSPTRASLMTGVYPQRCGVPGVLSAAQHREKGLDPQVWRSLPSLLKEAGYATGLSGKWHLGYRPQFNPIRHGFDMFRGYLAGNVDYFSHVDQSGVFDWWDGLTPRDEQGYVTDLVTDRAVEFIEWHRGVPFFLQIAHAAPHYPYQGPTDRAERQVGGEINIYGRRHEDPQVYGEMLAALDRAVGRVLSRLEHLGLDSNTVVFFTSDHGAPRGHGSNAPYRGFKSQLYEGGIRVPLLVRSSGRIASGVTTSVTATTCDLFATILEMAGASHPSYELDGVSLDRHLLASQLLAPRTLFWTFEHQLAARRDRWKLLIPDLRQGDALLFDLDADPGEQTDLAAERPQVAAELRRTAEQWHRQATAATEGATA